MDEVFVSIVMPVYNEEKYIVNCIDSLLKQDYSQNLMEWIFVDGMSSDNTKQLIQQYIEKYPTLIKVYDNPNKTVPYDVMMGPEVLIYTSGHEHSRTDIPMIKQGSFEEKRVIIGDDCWIGRRAIIMPGVEIAKGCIIGAGAVVTKNTQPYGIYGGVPAKRMKER